MRPGTERFYQAMVASKGYSKKKRKELTHDDIDRHLQEFIARGGAIEQIAFGVTTDPEAAIEAVRI